MTEREALADIVRTIGVLTYGKERWFKQNGCWYDRANGDYIQNETLVERICYELEAEIEAEQTEPQTDCETCKWGEWYRKGYDITMMSDECGGCCSWNNKWTPKDEPQTDCAWK